MLADFQGVLKSTEGETLLDGLSRECSKSFMPHPDNDYASVKTDLFALGSAVYFIMTGHEVFPELDSWKDDDEEEISSRFEKGLFPTDEHACYQIKKSAGSNSTSRLMTLFLIYPSFKRVVGYNDMFWLRSAVDVFGGKNESNAHLVVRVYVCLQG